MSKLDELLSKWESGGSKRILKIAEGQQVVARMFPPYDEEAEERARKEGVLFDPVSGILIFQQHKFLPLIGKDAEGRPAGKDGYPVTNYRCCKGLTKVVKKGTKKVRVPMVCGFCKFFDSLGEEDKQIKKDHGSEQRACVDLFIPKLGITQRFFFSKRTTQKFNDLFGYIPNVNDPKKGRNIIIQRTTDQFDPYTIRAGKESKLTVPQDEWPDILDELDNLRIVTPERAVEILKVKYGKRVRI